MTLAKLWIPACRPGEDCRVSTARRWSSWQALVRNRPRLNILNNDGQPHPAENIAAILVLVSGLVSFVLGLVIRNSHTGPAAHIIATATGLAALLVGLYLQMVSSTRNQRVVIVAGIIAGFVGLAIGLSCSRGCCGFVG